MISKKVEGQFLQLFNEFCVKHNFKKDTPTSEMACLCVFIQSKALYIGAKVLRPSQSKGALLQDDEIEQEQMIVMVGGMMLAAHVRKYLGTVESKSN